MHVFTSYLRLDRLAPTCPRLRTHRAPAAVKKGCRFLAGDLESSGERREEMRMSTLSSSSVLFDGREKKYEREESGGPPHSSTHMRAWRRREVAARVRGMAMRSKKKRERGGKLQCRYFFSITVTFPRPSLSLPTFTPQTRPPCASHSPSSSWPSSPCSRPWLVSVGSGARRGRARGMHAHPKPTTRKRALERGRLPTSFSLFTPPLPPTPLSSPGAASHHGCYAHARCRPATPARGAQGRG